VLYQLTEYILGIGHLTPEDCEQVLRETNERILELEQARRSVQKEINVLKTIEFQTMNRKKELQEQAQKESKNV
jgi:hypothetical protein